MRTMTSVRFWYVSCGEVHLVSTIPHAEATCLTLRSFHWNKKSDGNEEGKTPLKNSRIRSLSVADTNCCDGVPDGVLRYVAEPSCLGGYMCWNGPYNYYTCPVVDGIQMFFDENIGNCVTYASSAAVTCKSSCPGEVAADIQLRLSSSPVLTANDTCPYGNDNLGTELSASDFPDVFPVFANTAILQPNGREAQVSMLVGGSYIGSVAAEIEGRIVVLGDFLIGARGAEYLGTYMNYNWYLRCLEVVDGAH